MTSNTTNHAANRQELLRRLGRLRAEAEGLAWAIVASCPDDEVADTTLFAVRSGAFGEGAEYDENDELVAFKAAPPDKPRGVKYGLRCLFDAWAEVARFGREGSDATRSDGRGQP